MAPAASLNASEDSALISLLEQDEAQLEGEGEDGGDLIEEGGEGENDDESESHKDGDGEEAVGVEASQGRECCNTCEDVKHAFENANIPVDQAETTEQVTHSTHF